MTDWLLLAAATSTPNKLDAIRGISDLLCNEDTPKLGAGDATTYTEVLLDCLDEHRESVDLLTIGLYCLGSLLDSYPTIPHAGRTLDLIVNVMLEHTTHPLLQRAGCTVYSLVLVSEAPLRDIDDRIVDAAVSAMHSFPADAILQTRAALAVFTLLRVVPALLEKMTAARVVYWIALAMDSHPNMEEMQRVGCPLLGLLVNHPSAAPWPIMKQTKEALVVAKEFWRLSPHSEALKTIVATWSETVQVMELCQAAMVGDQEVLLTLATAMDIYRNNPDLVDFCRGAMFHWLMMRQ